MNNRPLIIIAGPTAVGKSDISVKLAKAINGSVISADSMQVYKGMDIGTAKITPSQMCGIPHYLIDVLEPSDDFDIVLFKKMAEAAIEDIYLQGRIPIICGGTGFYIQSILYDIDFKEADKDDVLRERLFTEAEEKGREYLYGLLLKTDPEAAEKISPNDTKRIVRALEYYKMTGEKISLHNKIQSLKESPYDHAYFVLTDDRDKIYKRIDERVDKMIENGLVDEVKALYDNGLDENKVSMHGLGYKEIIAYLKGRTDLSEAVRIIKRDTRHFAKRQLTWFKREKDVIYIQRSEPGEMLDEIMEELRRRRIIEDEQ